MSSLQRYKKSGGFFQLLSLIETFGPQKKEKFLEMIDAESKVWGAALREKMLTLERIFTWPDQVVIEIFKSLPITSMAYALEGIKPEHKARIMVFISASEKRKIDDAVGDKKPKPEEIASIMVKVLETTRKMLNARELHPEKFDEKLIIPEEFEARLAEADAGHFASSSPSAGSHGGGGGSSPDEPSVPDMSHLAAVASGQPVAATLEVAQLQRTLAAMMKENKQLKEEVRHMREKLDQIKKVAA